MRKHLYALALLIIGAGIAWIYFTYVPGSQQTASREQGSPLATNVPPPAQSTPQEQSPETSHLADNLNAPEGTIQADLRIIEEILTAWQTNFPRLGNPAGENNEITAALTGNNPLKLALIPIDHPAINPKGELCDRWGTPFFFHQLDSHAMELRSAGSDKTLYTDDDILVSASR